MVPESGAQLSIPSSWEILAWAHELKELGQSDGRSVVEALAEADQIMGRAARVGDKLFVDATIVNSVKDGPPDGSKEALLTAAIDAGEVKSHNNPVGRLWQKAMKENLDMANIYAEVGKCYTKQREFKLEWAKKQCEELKEVRTRIVESKKSDGAWGEYHPFAIHVRDEGGDAVALKACQDYFVFATRMAAEGKTHKGQAFFSSSTSTTTARSCCASWRVSATATRNQIRPSSRQLRARLLGRR